MPPKISSSTHQRIKEFNNAYGVSFDVKEYLKKAKETSPNEALKEMYANIYKTVLYNDLLNHNKPSNEEFKSYTLFRSFNNSIISSLKNDISPSDKEYYPHKNAKMSALQAYTLMGSIQNSMPKSDVEMVMESYQCGKLRIRDMMALAKKNQYSPVSPTDSVLLASYAEALTKINQTRSGAWKFFHPFRNHAEQRDAKSMKELVDSNGQISYKSAARQANQKLSFFETIKFNTTTRVLGVSNVKDYNPLERRERIADLDPILDKKEFDTLVQEQMEEDRRLEEERRRQEEEEKRRLEEEALKRQEEEEKKNLAAKENDPNEKTRLTIPDLKENPYANNENNQKQENEKTSSTLLNK